MREQTGPLFFVDNPPSASGEFIAPLALHKHLRARRLRPNDPIRLLERLPAASASEHFQTPRVWPALIRYCGPEKTVLEVMASSQNFTQPTAAIHLAVGVIATDRMSWLLEKACELGAASITPLVLERSQYRFDFEQAQKKRRHWQEQVIAAAEQSENLFFPWVSLPVSLSDWLDHLTASAQRIVLLAQADTALAELPAVRERILLSGCEGGFSNRELEQIAAAGFVSAHLGSRVLRAETAPLAALALFNAR